MAAYMAQRALDNRNGSVCTFSGDKEYTLVSQNTRKQKKGRHSGAWIAFV